ncbi:MAG: glycosyl transferase [Alphaproteobacteria bacterium]|nr:glycosyl transferase [Alphaproteobacteria bacterium]
MKAGRVFFYVQHLLGIGHAARAAILTRAMRRAGLDVVVAAGGFDALDDNLLGADVVRLPPVKARDATFSALIGANGQEIDDAWRARRCTALLQAFETSAADVVLIETFPFGRWPFRFELLPLLDAAKGRARILCSLRDILVPKRNPARLTAIVDLIERYFDGVLVHGDPDFVTLDRTFPRTRDIAGRIRYTGYVAPEAPAHDAAPVPQGEVIVSAGGGGTGGALMRTALAARPLGDLRDTPWRMLVGPNLPSHDRAALQSGDGFTIEPARGDFPALLAGGALSISQAGYNTVLDLLQARCRCVLVPFSAHGQSEQALRAALLERRGWAHMLPEAALTPSALAAAADRAAGMERPCPGEIDLDGARRSAEFVADRAGGA